VGNKSQDSDNKLTVESPTLGSVLIP